MPSTVLATTSEERRSSFYITVGAVTRLLALVSKRRWLLTELVMRPTSVICWLNWV